MYPYSNLSSPKKGKTIINKDKDKVFEALWIDENVNKNYRADNILTNRDYVLYNVWRQFNDQRLYKQYLPNTTVISGSMNRTDKIIFHGGCLTCISQSKHRVRRCFNCQYFRADWNKKDLSIKTK